MLNVNFSENIKNGLPKLYDSQAKYFSIRSWKALKAGSDNNILRANIPNTLQNVKKAMDIFQIENHHFEFHYYEYSIY